MRGMTMGMFLTLVFAGCVGTEGCTDTCRADGAPSFQPDFAAVEGAVLGACEGDWMFGRLPFDVVDKALPVDYRPAPGPAGVATVEVQAFTCRDVSYGEVAYEQVRFVRTYAWVVAAEDPTRFGLFLFDLLVDGASGLSADWSKSVGARSAEIDVSVVSGQVRDVRQWSVAVDGGTASFAVGAADGFADSFAVDVTFWHAGSAPPLLASGSAAHGGEPGGVALVHVEEALELPTVGGVLPVTKTLDVQEWTETLGFTGPFTPEENRT